MPGKIRFVCLLHSHQPVGNFDHVIEDAYKASYLPYVELFEKFPAVPLTNHFSGCLLEWLESHHPEYLKRLAKNCKSAKDRKGWEMVGGGFYEPIMAMLPLRDRIGQIQLMASFIEKHFKTKPLGMWLPERVWEPAMAADLADAGAHYLTLDDSHFRAAGLPDEALTGPFITEDEGRMLTVFPASEKLRYMIPYASVKEFIEWLKSQVPEEGEKVLCYADDGEKFGVWPRSFKHVFTDGWLEDFLTALTKASDEGWLECCTLADAYENTRPVGKVYLPENSYREMTEWALPSLRLADYEEAVDSIKKDKSLSVDPRVKILMSMVKGGNWRSFKTKYPEGARMYAKMMEISNRLASSKSSKKTEAARTHLYRGQCNCPYWHGVFGGMYLPHLRSAVYSELVKADTILEDAAPGSPAICVSDDFDFDGNEEIKLSNSELALYLHPGRGGHLYEMDLRAFGFNAADTFSRRFEAYHVKVSRAVLDSDVKDDAHSIHDLVLAKQAGLTELLKYDSYLRESLVDHLCEVPLTPDLLLSGNPPSDPGFRDGHYEATIIKGKAAAKAIEGAPVKDASHCVELTRTQKWQDEPVTVTKRVALSSAGHYVAEYVIENKGTSRLRGWYGVEMNYSLLAGDAHDRYFFHEYSDNAGKLASASDFGLVSMVGLVDHWQKIRLTLKSTKPARVCVSPVKTVSQSEGGFEAVYQSSAVLLQWALDLPPGAAFTVALTQEVAGT